MSPRKYTVTFLILKHTFNMRCCRYCGRQMSTTADANSNRQHQNSHLVRTRLQESSLATECPNRRKIEPSDMCCTNQRQPHFVESLSIRPRQLSLQPNRTREVRLFISKKRAACSFETTKIDFVAPHALHHIHPDAHDRQRVRQSTRHDRYALEDELKELGSSHTEDVRSSSHLYEWSSLKLRMSEQRKAMKIAYGAQQALHHLQPVSSNDLVSQAVFVCERRRKPS